jgi:hypothetical protein
MLERFEPAMYAGKYEVSIMLGSHQVLNFSLNPSNINIRASKSYKRRLLDLFSLLTSLYFAQIGQPFPFEIVEGPADAQNTQVVLSGPWRTVAGKPLHFRLVCHDGAMNEKQNGGDEVEVSDAKVFDRRDGSYDVEWMQRSVGRHGITIRINGEAKASACECEVVAADADAAASRVEILSLNPSVSIASQSDASDYTIVAGTRCAVSVRLFDTFGNPRIAGNDKVSVLQLAPVFENEQVGSEILLRPAGAMTYEYQGLVLHASAPVEGGGGGDGEPAGLTVLVNGLRAGKATVRLDVLPGDVSLARSFASVPASGVHARAGEPIEFEVLVRDSWDNCRVRTTDAVEVVEYDAAGRHVVGPWPDCQVKSLGDGRYRVSARHTLARESSFTYTVNGASAASAGQVHSIVVTPHDVSVSECQITGEDRASVGQYVSQLISLRDSFGNVLSPEQLESLELAVGEGRVLDGDIGAEELRLTSRVTNVEHHPGQIYTHRLVCTTQQAVHVSLDLNVGGSLLKVGKRIESFG